MGSCFVLFVVSLIVMLLGSCYFVLLYCVGFVFCLNDTHTSRGSSTLGVDRVVSSPRMYHRFTGYSFIRMSRWPIGYRDRLETAGQSVP